MKQLLNLLRTNNLVPRAPLTVVKNEATGEHVFYERQGDGPETRVGRARFTQMWKQEGTEWKLARVFSYDHSPLP